MSNTYQKSRRDFMKNISLVGGGLMLGFKWNSAHAEMPSILNAADPMAVPALNSYLSIAPDGIIHIFSPNPELGQNIMTSFAQIVAEELDADWTKVRVSQAPLDTKAFDRQLTGGSGAIPHSWMRLRKAGASARYLLLHAAAKQWNVPADECTADTGMIIHKPSGKNWIMGHWQPMLPKLNCLQKCH
jgi:isoquinoline 1-oxidoreductase subunit beta